MIEVFWRYRVHPSQARAFEHAYGSNGPWAALFGRNSGYKRTRLFRHQDDPSIYLAIDVWQSKADWDAFRSEHADEYLHLDRQLTMLKMEEHLLGYYDGTDEYQPPVDTLA
jgi:heme-degrading monooxygenase HmoA